MEYDMTGLFENTRGKTSFAIAAMWTVIFAVVLFGTAITMQKVVALIGSPLDQIPGLVGFVAAIAAILTATFIEKIYDRTDLRLAFLSLGFKSGRWQQVIPVIGGLICLSVGYLVIAFALHKSADLVPGASFLLLKLLVSQGLIEEAVFRGLIFRRLRQGRSFWQAAALSGLLFALIHVVNLAKGTTPEIMFSILISILFGFILTFPLAALFELGGGSIWAGAILHLAIDSINCFKDLGEAGLAMNTYLAFLFVAGVVTLILARRATSSITEIGRA
jgi:membrane protease YdiL (CAAX protease family)